MQHTTKTAIVYHQVKLGVDCPDGIAAAWVAKQRYPDTQLIGASYRSTIPDVKEFDHLLIVDFSFDIALLRQWQSEGKDVMVIDHHQTAMQDLQDFSNAAFDMSESGATLTWKTLFPNQTMPAWLEYVRDHDLWQHKLPYTEEVHEAVSNMGRSLELIDWLATLSHTELQAELVPRGTELLEQKRIRVAQIAETATRASILGHSAMTVWIPEDEVRLTSNACHAICELYPETAFTMAYSWNETDNVWDLSFRSSKDSNFDVSEVAKQFEGGGHRNAAGGRVSDLKLVIEGF